MRYFFSMVIFLSLFSVSWATDDHLLLCEAVLTPTSDEFIEIYNPTGSVINLDNYFLSDDEDYALISGNAGAGPVPNIGISDFIIQFPSNTSISPNQTIIIAFDGSGFISTFGINPDFEIKGTEAGIMDMIAITDITSSGLTNSGENIALFYWDGVSDLVQDIDLINLGTPSSSNDIGDKTGVSVDGPDVDSVAATYNNDAYTIPQQSSDPGFGFSTKRIFFETGLELPGGNGVTGDDETTEDITISWDSIYTAPNPGNCTLSLSQPNIVINEVDADTSGSDTLEFIELFGDPNLSLDGLTIVLYNGSDDASYESFDLDGFSTDANGFFVLGNMAVSNVSLVFSDNTLQNGADAVALIEGDAINYPNDTPVSSVGLIDALVYDTSDGDDSGLIDVLAPGQPQQDERGAGDGSLHSNSRVPDGGMPLVTSTYVQQISTPGESNNAPMAIILNIHEIQGSGDVSPFSDMVITTNDNIVTAVGLDGFTIQSKDSNTDANPETSEGIYVFTSSLPTVAVGDQVDVTGQIVEFFGFTMISNTPVVSIDSSGNNLPSIVSLTTSFPSSDPNSPTCTAGSLECVESMLVQMNGITTSGSQSFGLDPIAEAKVVVGTNRTFREPGIEFPGLPGLPIWDGNPEIFEIDPDRFGAPNAALIAGSQFSATGVIGYEFGDYEIWPTNYTITNTPPIPVPVRQPINGEMTIGSLNMFRFFNDIDDPAVNGRDDAVVSTLEYNTRRAKFVNYISNVLGSPDILAVQEVESLTVLNDLASDIFADSGTSYTAQLIEGNDLGTIDIGFLIKDNVNVNAVTQLGANELHTFDSTLLHDKPPLLLEASYSGNGMPFDVGIFVVHLRSINGTDDTIIGERVRSKRLQQSQSIATMAQDFQTNNPNTPMVIVGDFNAYEFSDGYVDVVGQIRGVATPSDNLVSDTNITVPPLSNQVFTVPNEQRYSFNFGGNAQVLDHALTSSVADLWVRGFEFGKGNSDISINELDNGNSPLRASDHDGFVLYMMTDFDADTVPDDIDNCPINANQDQSDSDMDGIGDVCDSCDANTDSVFSVTGQTINQISGTVTQCAGINTVILDTNANNINLTTAGNPGDALWTFEISLIDPTIDGSTSLIANGTINSNTSMLFSLVGDFDSDMVPDDIDNCPLNANSDQSDSDMDGIGDVCDSCDANVDSVFSITDQTINQISGNVTQCSGINSVLLDANATNVSLTTTGNAGDLLWSFEIDLIDPTIDGSTFLISNTDNTSTTSILYSLIGDFDADLIPDDLDNCPQNANSDQADSDMDGIGDVCDTCDANSVAIFKVVEQNATQIYGTVEQCAGINSIMLGVGSDNMILSTTGSIGDPIWTFLLELSNSYEDGAAMLIVQGSVNTTSSSLYSLLGLPPEVIPTISFFGMLFLVLTLLIISSLKIKRLNRQ